MSENLLGATIKEARIQKGFSLRELARRTSISHPYLSQLENNHNKKPSPLFIKKIADALDLSYFELANMTGDMTESEIVLTGIEEMMKEMEGGRKEYEVTFKVTNPSLSGHAPFPPLSLNDENEAEKYFLGLENLLTMKEDIYLNNEVLDKQKREKTLKLIRIENEKNLIDPLIFENLIGLMDSELNPRLNLAEDDLLNTLLKNDLSFFGQPLSDEDKNKIFNMLYVSFENLVPTEVKKLIPRLIVNDNTENEE